MYKIKWKDANTEVSTYNDIESALFGYDIEVRNTEWKGDKLYDALILENTNGDLLVFASAYIEVDDYGKEKAHTAHIYSVEARDDLVEMLKDIAMDAYYIDTMREAEILQ